jgi:hypothetical protein
MLAAVPPLPLYVFMAWYLVKHRDNFTFTDERDCPQMWNVAANMSNEQSRTAEKGVVLELDPILGLILWYVISNGKRIKDVERGMEG